MKSHCSLSYHILPPDEVENFALLVKAGYYGNNPPFTVLPITEADFEALITAYVNKRADYVNGGLAQKPDFLLAKNALMSALDLLAAQADIVANGDSTTISLAGFVPTKTGSSTPAAPAQPAAPVIKRGASGELFAEVPAVAGASSYGCILFATQPMPANLSLNAAGQLIDMKDGSNPGSGGSGGSVNNGGILVAIDLNKNRKKKFMGLQPHITYYFYFWAVNSTGVSALSGVSSLECL